MFQSPHQNIIQQDVPELAALIALLPTRCRRMVEIGVLWGGTARYWAEALPDTEILAIDVSLDELRTSFETVQNVTLMRADSHDPATPGLIRDWLAGEPLDAAFIDGDHTIEGVELDARMMDELVRPGGAIAFHDIHALAAPGVMQFWQEFSKDRYSVEVQARAPGCHASFGIGVIYKTDWWQAAADG